jgi:hypothetical protein
MLHTLEICENGEEAKVAGECWRCEQTHHIDKNFFVPKLLRNKLPYDFLKEIAKKMGFTLFALSSSF